MAELAEAEARERRRLADALHDDALQHLVAARQEIHEAAGGDTAALGAAGRLIDEAIASLRRLTRSMHDEALAGAGLDEALRRLADEAGRRGRFETEVRVESDSLLHHDAVVVGIARELLANVAKHAEASAVTVEASVSDGGLEVVVTDDGRGIAPGAIENAENNGHLGHVRLRRQVEVLSGRLDVSTPDGGGARVAVRLPVSALETQRTLGDMLRRERVWSAALVAALQDGLIVLRDGRVVQVNDRFCAMTGFTREELYAGERDAHVFWPPERMARQRDMVLHSHEGQAMEAEMVFLRKDGSRFPVLAASRTIRDDTGGHAGTLVTIKDITKREAAERRARLERDLASAKETTAVLRRIIQAARVVDDDLGYAALVAGMTHAISDRVGWAVVLNVVRPEWDETRVEATSGLAPAGEQKLLGATYPLSDWDRMLAEHYERRGAYVMLHGRDPEPPEILGPDWRPDIPESDDPTLWHPDDMLFTVARNTAGERMAVLSFDMPRTARRPSDAELDVLVEMTAYAGLALEHATDSMRGTRRRKSLLTAAALLSTLVSAPDRPGLFDELCAGCGAATGFGLVAAEAERGGPGSPLELLGQDGAAGVDFAPGVTMDDIVPLFDEAHALAGGYLLSAEAIAQGLPAGRAALARTTRSGRGPAAWGGRLLAVPLTTAGGRRIGVLWAQNPDSSRIPDEMRAGSIWAFAQLLSVAIAMRDSVSG